MPLYIKDPEVDDLVKRYQKLSRAASKTDAVRKALERSIAELAETPSLADIAVTFCRDLKSKADASRAAPADKAFVDSLYE